MAKKINLLDTMIMFWIVTQIMMFQILKLQDKDSPGTLH